MGIINFLECKLGIFGLSNNLKFVLYLFDSLYLRCLYEISNIFNIFFHYYCNFYKFKHWRMFEYKNKLKHEDIWKNKK